MYIPKRKSYNKKKTIRQSTLAFFFNETSLIITHPLSFLVFQTFAYFVFVFLNKKKRFFFYTIFFFFMFLKLNQLFFLSISIILFLKLQRNQNCIFFFFPKKKVK